MMTNNDIRKINGIIFGGMGGFGFGAILAACLCGICGEYESYTWIDQTGEIHTSQELTDEALINYLTLPWVASIVVGILFGYLYAQKETIGQNLKNMCLTMFDSKGTVNTATPEHETRKNINNSDTLKHK